MIGLGDLYIVSAVFGCIAITAVGVVFGACNWNRGDEKEDCDRK